jgi:hypothetical protein
MREVAIKRAQVYGMRCSGTNYLDNLIRKNMPDLALGAASPRVRRTFGWKHADVGTNTYLHYHGHLHDVEIMRFAWAESRDTLLFVIYRNPIAWLQSLHRNPHQSPESYGLDFSTFIRQPFRAFHCDPPGSESHPDPRVRRKQIKSKNLLESYESVFAMRKNKIMIFDSFRHRFENVVYVNLETLEQDPERFLREIADCFNLHMCPDFVDVTGYKGGSTPYVKTQYEPLSVVDLQHIMSNVDWATEAMVGYRPKLRSKLLAWQPQPQTDPENLLNIFSHKRYYKHDHLLMSQKA